MGIAGSAQFRRSNPGQSEHTQTDISSFLAFFREKQKSPQIQQSLLA
jgi:hypothetical protein